MAALSTSTTGVLRCLSCGRTTGEFSLCQHGEAVCSAHRLLDQCVLCSLPRTADSAGWTRYTVTGHRCPTCAADAVESERDARRWAEAVCVDLARIGIRLGHRVKVDLVCPDSLQRTAGGAHGFVGGSTRRRYTPFGGTEATGITIARGLTGIHFGSTLAHEIGHCWLTEQGIDGLAAPIEEGVCQVFAGAWLKKQDGRLAGALRDALDSPDEVYGVGYRLVRTAIRERGINAVLTCLRERRRLMCL